MDNQKPSPIEVGQRIKNIRQQEGLSMDDFGSKVDGKAKSGAVANWETGKNLPNSNRLKRIAEIGNVSVDFLLHGSRDLLGNEMPIHELSLFNYEIIKTRVTKIKGSKNLSMIVLIKLYHGENIQASFLNCRFISNNDLEINELHIDDIRYFDYVDLQPNTVEGQKQFFNNIRLNNLEDIVVFSDYRRLKKRVLKDFDSVFFQELYDKTVKENIKNSQLLADYTIQDGMNLYFIEDDYKFRLINITL